MKLLLDTHELIWWSSSSEKLSLNVYNLIVDPSNTLMFSIASIWEMQIKLQSGKLNLNSALSNLIERQQQVNKLQILPIELSHIYALESLPSHHRDPFDRILIAQSIVENIPLLSIDMIFDSYPVQKIWE
ncbi:type II toxin-antitoxin system VapC family toxin [Halotia branconii]|uniref:Type II toxin-antitoxin system VapC family toxin n=1 Tax=Halotia branconii CENA392 TaxID=1539056 RepID=A0AAJ6NWP4_9CYAN|nr:type II toxin-antitoxin system VapC family toxin [Halotia branconii]WGV27878.1 type II toxin-antitoxin system VapC family toxin [Halotia branconii CENA392]